MRGEVHILVNCPIDTFLKEKQHSAVIAFDIAVMAQKVKVQY